MNEQPKVLIIDDDEPFVDSLTINLAEANYQVFSTPNLSAGLKDLTEKKILVVLVSANQDEGESLETLKSLKIYLPFVEVIILARKGNFKIACRAMSLGAHNFLVKSSNSEEFISVIGSAYRKANRNYKKEIEKNDGKWSVIKPSATEFIGQSTAIKGIQNVVSKVAPTNASVLISGETGVGKELVARMVHQNSKRSQAPFIPINCGAIPENLLENELFGHTKGAFTDSVNSKLGLLEEANKGTLFLDEVTELSATLQVKLLRVIETGTFRRLGDNQERWVDVRIVSATNRNIADEVKSGRFRSDFYYRLAVMNIQVYPLRMRPDDIMLLVGHFSGLYEKNNGQKRKPFSPSAIQMLLEYDWPGNIRELKNFVERVHILSENETITPADVALAIPSLDDYQILWEELDLFSNKAPHKIKPLSEMQQKYIQYVINQANGNLEKAAEMINIPLEELRDKIATHSAIEEQI
ncbi:MAG: sigma-54-dependent Fis family transcriptional regulator [Planctomycetes bacterium]|nr:sigma-54-dependent Fis family transcriptional regulator [Planctomycetota bacterium]